MWESWSDGVVSCSGVLLQTSLALDKAKALTSLGFVLHLLKVKGMPAYILASMGSNAGREKEGDGTGPTWMEVADNEKVHISFTEH